MEEGGMEEGGMDVKVGCTGVVEEGVRVWWRGDR